MLAFSPNTTANGDITVGVDTLRVLLPRYVTYATAPATLNSVAERLGEPRSELGEGVDATISSDNGNVTITATMPTSDRAADGANAVARETLDFYEDDTVLEGVVVSPALPASSPSGPPRRLIQLASVLVGVILGAAVALSLERGRPRVRTWRDVGSSPDTRLWGACLRPEHSGARRSTR